MSISLPSAVALHGVLNSLFQPHQTLVLVVDKQYSYMDSGILKARNMSPSTASVQALQRLDEFIVNARKKGVAVAWTQMTEQIDESPEPISQKMKIDRNLLGLEIIECAKGGKGYEIYGNSVPSKDEKVFQKNHYDAFSNPELVDWLRGHGYISVILVGGFASRCVLGTAFGANNHDIHVLVLEDLLVTPDRFASEVPSMLEIVSGILGYVTKSETLLGSWAS